MIRFAIKALTTAIIVWALLENMGLDAVILHLSSIEFRYLAIATALGVILAFFAGLRWYFIIKTTGHHLGWFRTLEITMIGAFFNQFLPSAMGGDLARIPYARRAGLPLLPAVNSVILDRIAAFVALILLVIICLPPSFSIVQAPEARWTLLAIAAGGLGGTALLLGFRQMPGFMSRHRLLGHALSLSLLLHTAVLSRQAPSILFYSLLTHVFRVLAVYALARGMMLDVSFYDSLILVPPAMLVTALPVSVGGWGVREGAFVIAFGFMGVQAEQAFALSALFGLTTMAAGLFGGLFWIIHRKHP
ncbi:MAG: lysylphosphatidylglycerol synthase transmembrane domain-containing protein [Gammaproteobacteria bacterium]